MKLPIKKKYFDKIKTGEKLLEYRDAHITFICEETGEKLRAEVIGVEIRDRDGIFPDVLEDNKVIQFTIEVP